MSIVIAFQFYPTTHSAVLADYLSPCVPWSSQHVGQSDTWSGLITQQTPSVDVCLSNITYHQETITNEVQNNSRQPGHGGLIQRTHGSSIVALPVRVKPTEWFSLLTRMFSCPITSLGCRITFYSSADQTFETFKSKALQADYEMSPGQTPPSESTNTPTPNTSGSKSISTGAIVGIVVGAIAAAALVGMLFFLIGRSRRKSASEKAAAAATTTAPLAQPALDAGFVPGAYGDNPPPEYHGQGQLQPAWDGKGLAPPAPPLSPVHSQYNSHSSMYGGPSPTNPHTSWVPSELGGESTIQSQRVEIYTPGVDDRIPLNNPPRSP